MKLLSKQDVFDIVWYAFIVAGLPQSLKSFDSCLYAGYHGTGCSIGILVSRNLAERLDKVPCCTVIHEGNVATGITSKLVRAKIVRAPGPGASIETIERDTPYLYREIVENFEEDVDLSFLSELQIAHDTSGMVTCIEYDRPQQKLNFVSQLKAALRLIAERHHLTVPPDNINLDDLILPHQDNLVPSLEAA